MDIKYDAIVVGSGAAGCALVDRLHTDNKDWKILLIESGPTSSPPKAMNDCMPTCIHTVKDDVFVEATENEPYCHSMLNKSGVCPPETARTATGEVSFNRFTQRKVFPCVHGRVLGGNHAVNNGALACPPVHDLACWPQRLWKYSDFMASFCSAVRELPHVTRASATDSWSDMERLVVDAAVASMIHNKARTTKVILRTAADRMSAGVESKFRSNGTEGGAASDPVFYFEPKRAAFDAVYTDTANPFGIYAVSLLAKVNYSAADYSAGQGRQGYVHTAKYTRSGMHDRANVWGDNVKIVTYAHATELLFNHAELDAYASRMQQMRALEQQTCGSSDEKVVEMCMGRHRKFDAALETVAEYFGTVDACGACTRDYTRVLRSDYKKKTGSEGVPAWIAEEACRDPAHPLAHVISADLEARGCLAYLPPKIKAVGVRVLMNKKACVYNENMISTWVETILGGSCVDGAVDSRGIATFAHVPFSNSFVRDAVEKASVKATVLRKLKKTNAWATAEAAINYAMPSGGGGGGGGGRQAAAGDDEENEEAGEQRLLGRQPRSTTHTPICPDELAAEMCPRHDTETGNVLVEFRAARYVFVCAGAIQTPRLLMRSGIGSIEQIAALRSSKRLLTPHATHYIANNHVGKHLQDQVYIPITLETRTKMEAFDRHLVPLITMFTPNTREIEQSDIVRLQTAVEAEHLRPVRDKRAWREAANKNKAAIAETIPMHSKLTFTSLSSSMNGAVRLDSGSPGTAGRMFWDMIDAAADYMQLACPEDLGASKILIKAGTAAPLSEGEVGYDAVRFDFLSDVGERDIDAVVNALYVTDTISVKMRAAVDDRLAPAGLAGKKSLLGQLRGMPVRATSKSAADVSTAKANIYNALKNEGFYSSTTRMAECSTQGVVSPSLRIYGTENAYVASNAVFPRVLSVAPSGAAMAVATRLGGLIKELESELCFPSGNK